MAGAGEDGLKSGEDRPGKPAVGGHSIPQGPETKRLRADSIGADPTNRPTWPTEEYAFQACSFNHSDISPCKWNQQFSAGGDPRKTNCDATVT